MVGGLAAAAIALAPMTARADTQAPSGTHQVDDVLLGLSGLSSTPTAGDTPVQVGLILANPSASGMDDAYRAIYTPGSPEYHHFLNADQVAARFGVPSATTSAVTSWASRDGMRPVFASHDGAYVLLSGTAAQAEQTFAVALKDYTVNGASFYANDTAPTVPSAVVGVIGLNNKLASHTFNHTAAGQRSATPAQDLCDPTNSVCTGFTTPEDLWSAYDQPTNLSDSSADFGQGQQM
ncbi:MAG TPA: protease pro-enzyme activation domain-containing protein, partial [Acidimicrobiales bacterium]|nr:protease pro-enzyme activation domain-containing protein [Acidimicrobiales bacterium]